MTRTLIIATIITAAGCFRYTAVEPSTVAPGESVRVSVTREGSRELVEATGTERPVPSLDGRVDRWVGDDLVLRVSVADRREGFASTGIEQMIRVPSGEILSLERRETDALATGVLVAGIVAGSTGLVLLIMEAWGDSPEVPDDDPVVFFSIPIG